MTCSDVVEPATRAQLEALSVSADPEIARDAIAALAGDRAAHVRCSERIYWGGGEALP
jgi:hypothetical protein